MDILKQQSTEKKYQDVVKTQLFPEMFHHK